MQLCASVQVRLTHSIQSRLQLLLAVYLGQHAAQGGRQGDGVHFGGKPNRDDEPHAALQEDGHAEDGDELVEDVHAGVLPEDVEVDDARLGNPAHPHGAVEIALPEMGDALPHQVAHLDEDEQGGERGHREEDRSLRPLPAKHIDTGMGFERLVSVLQNKRSNYDTDVFAPIFAGIERITGERPYMGRLGDADKAKLDSFYRVIEGHFRTLRFVITAGWVLSNEGRGYLLRRILRRARSTIFSRKAMTGWVHTPIGTPSRSASSSSAGELTGRAGTSVQALPISATVCASEPALIGKTIGHNKVQVQDIKDLADTIRERGLQVGVIATPAEAAQGVARTMVEAGIKAILNYAPINLTVPSNVRVQYIDPVAHLQRMTYYLD